MKVFVKNGTIVSAGEQYQGDICIEDGVISQIGKGFPREFRPPEHRPGSAQSAFHTVPTSFIPPSPVRAYTAFCPCLPHQITEPVCHTWPPAVLLSAPPPAFRKP